MRLARLQLRNYRQFVELDLEIGPTMVLVGANDAGKSTILEALRLILRTPRGDLDTSGSWGVVRHQPVEPEATSIVATFSDLTTEEAGLAQAALSPDGELRLGRIWRVSRDEEASIDYLADDICLVLDVEPYGRVRRDRSAGDSESPAS